MYLPLFSALPFLYLLGYFLACVPQPVIGAPAPAGEKIVGRQRIELPPPNPSPERPPQEHQPPGDRRPGEPTPRDRTRHDEMRRMVERDRSHAGRHLYHYLGNGGADFTDYPENLMFDIPAFKEAVRVLAESWAVKTFAQARAGGGSTRTFVSPWLTFSIPREHSDWYYGLRVFTYSVSGHVKTQKVRDGWTGEMSLQVNLMSKYNWDTASGARIGGNIFPGTDLGRMRDVGLAREYNVRGWSNMFIFRPYNGGRLPMLVVQPR